MEISADRVKELREKSGAGVMDCKKALVESDGDIDRALALLREKGQAQAAKRSGREAGEGIVEAYVHNGKIGVIVEVNCETDFVARTPDFKALAHDVAMQIAATNPPEVGGPEAKTDAADDDLPLLQQAFIRDSSKTIADLVRETAAKTGENVVIRRFTRYELGA